MDTIDRQRVASGNNNTQTSNNTQSTSQTSNNSAQTAHNYSGVTAHIAHNSDNDNYSNFTDNGYTGFTPPTAYDNEYINSGDAYNNDHNTNNNGNHHVTFKGNDNLGNNHSQSSQYKFFNMVTDDNDDERDIDDVKYDIQQGLNRNINEYNELHVLRSENKALKQHIKALKATNAALKQKYRLNALEYEQQVKEEFFRKNYFIVKKIFELENLEKSWKLINAENTRLKSEIAALKKKI